MFQATIHSHSNRYSFPWLLYILIPSLRSDQDEAYRPHGAFQAPYREGFVVPTNL